MGRLELTAGDAVLQVDPSNGGRWTSLRVAGVELLTTSEDDEVPAHLASGCFPLAPFAGRMRDGVLHHRGRTWQLPRDQGPHALHGTVASVPWAVRSRSTDALLLQTGLADPWPFAGEVRLTLELHPDRLHVVLAVHAAEDMPVVLGLHPWFRRRLSTGGDAELRAEGGRQYAAAPDDVPTGELVDPRPPPWDDCFVGLRQPVRLVWPGALALEVRSDADHWVLYDERPEAVCVEPHTGPPDAARLGLACDVPAGGRHALDCTFAWSAA